MGRDEEGRKEGEQGVGQILFQGNKGLWRVCELGREVGVKSLWSGGEGRVKDRVLGGETEGLVQSLNDRDQGTNGCWEWVREKFIFLPWLCFS